MIGIALAALFSVGDDIDAGLLLVANSQEGGVVLRGFKLIRRDKPKIARPHARHLLRQARPVDEPFGLRIGADQTGGQHCHRHSSANRVATRRSNGTLSLRIPIERAKAFMPATNSGVIFAS